MNKTTTTTTNEWLVPQIVTKLIEAGQDEYRNT